MYSRVHLAYSDHRHTLHTPTANRQPPPSELELAISLSKMAVTLMDDFPENFKDPISHGMMVDPVMLAWYVQSSATATDRSPLPPHAPRRVLPTLTLPRGAHVLIGPP